MNNLEQYKKKIQELNNVYQTKGMDSLEADDILDELDLIWDRMTHQEQVESSVWLEAQVGDWIPNWLGKPGGPCED